VILQLLRKYTQLSDEDLVKKYQSSKDVYYVALLFERYNELTVSLAISYLKNKTDAEDATMECFELMVKDLKEVKVSNFGGWYYSLIRNYLLKVKRKRQRTVSEEDIEQRLDHDDESWRNIFASKDEELQLYVKELLETLKADQRICIERFYLEGKSYKEIELLDNMPEKKVKSHIQNGKRKLKIELEKRNVKSFNEIS
jgi:RNA polymerase sigma-70 factor (ECF subfamily)